jgi:hypothetical protein
MKPKKGNLKKNNENKAHLLGRIFQRFKKCTENIGRWNNKKQDNILQLQDHTSEIENQ